VENPAGLGLCQTHAYTIVAAQEVKTKDGSETKFLVQLRNPHHTNEWNGNFSDTDDFNWNRMETDLRIKDAGSANIDEGLFWMDLVDVKKYFAQLNACYFDMTDGTKFAQVRGVWPAALQSKNLVMGPTSLVHCSAFKFTLKAENAGKSRACMQVVLGYTDETGPVHMFYVYKVQESDLTNLQRVYDLGTPVLQTRAVKSASEISKWSMFEPGTYILVPLVRTAYDQSSKNVPIPAELKDKDIPFTIRLFSENETTIEEIKPQPQQDPNYTMADMLAKLQTSGIDLGGLDLSSFGNLDIQ